MRLLFFVLLFLIAGIFNAQNNVRIFSADGKIFKVFIHDKLYNKTPQASVLLESITKDTLYLKLEFENNQKHGATIYLLEKGKRTKNKEFNYRVELISNKLKVNYTGTHNVVALPNPLVPKEPVIDTMLKYKNTTLGHFCELKNEKPVYFNNVPKSGKCHEPMNSGYINYVNLLMSKAQVPDDKFDIAENTCKNNCLNVEQLNKLLLHIEFEIEKLKLVKLAYPHITDKTNEKNLSQTFKLEVSKKELHSLLERLSVEKEQTTANCIEPAKEEEMLAFRQSLSVYVNDAERFALLKKTYDIRCYTTTQVKTILVLFTHDREKLDAAKLLYFYCTDKGNYSNLKDVFNYTTTAADLNEFIEKQQK